MIKFYLISKTSYSYSKYCKNSGYLYQEKIRPQKLSPSK